MNSTSRLATILVLATSASLAAAKSPFRDLHDFDGLTLGNLPRGELVADAQGRLIGTTVYGGDWQEGTIYRLTLPTSPTGPVGYEILHSFGPGEGSAPEGGALIGADGAFYGTTDEGGLHNAGTVWRYDPKTSTLTTLHHFDPTASPPDGSGPQAGLTAGPNGLLYGTTASNGPLGYGVAFAISPRGDTVSYKIIHAFGTPGDGAVPNYGRLVAKGNTLYGVTNSGGVNPLFQYGTAYSLTLPAGSNTWTEAVIYYFASVTGDAFLPNDGVLMDKSGALYGCAAGGHNGRGAVYRLTSTGGGRWSQTILTSFGDNPGDPAASECWLELDKTGRLVGTSAGGGTFGQGSVFTLPSSGGSPTVVHSFGDATGAGTSPSSPVLPVPGGYYIGTTVFGGSTATPGNLGAGTIYGIKP